MSKEKGKQREKSKSSAQTETKSKEAKVSMSNENTKRITRMSNIKEEGFYNFKNMMIRNVKSQAETSNGKVSKRAKKRVKSKRAQK